MTRKQIQGYRNNLKGAVNACDNGATVELDLTTARKLVEIIDALQKAREDAIREAAVAMKPMLRSMISRGQAAQTILALLNEGEQNE